MPDAYGQALITCDSVAHDPNSGKVTLYGIFDRISSQKFPTVHALLSIYWRCQVPGPGRVGVSILKPDGSMLIDLVPVEHSREGPSSLQGTYTLAGTEFPADGEYTLSLRYNGKEILRSILCLIRQDA
jgi:hypothetical protein